MTKLHRHPKGAPRSAHGGATGELRTGGRGGAEGSEDFEFCGRRSLGRCPSSPEQCLAADGST
jgi:hypothetical protein